MISNPRFGRLPHLRMLVTIICCGLLFLSFGAGVTRAASPAPAGFHDAFTAEDIDWDNTTETPANPGIRNHPVLSYHDGILRAIGLVRPDGDGIMAHWGGAWAPAGKGYCRLAFKKPVAIGTILGGAGWSNNVDAGPVSILKPDAPYPGDVDNDTQWQPVERLAPVTGMSQFVLPPGADGTTRAVRIQGGVSAMRFLAGRYTNLLPRAAVVASGGEQESLQNNRAWGDNTKEDITPEHPQWLIFSWTAPQNVSGLMMSRPVFAQYDVAYFTGPQDIDPLGAPESDWKTLPAASVAKPWRAPNQSYFAFDSAVRTTAIRVRILRGFDQVEGGEGPRSVTLRGLSVLSDLGDTAATPTVAAAKPEHPPIAIPFHLDEEGYVTLTIDDAHGRRVRNLVSDTWFPAGDQTTWWDGLDESIQLDRRTHGVYTLAGKLVAPGAYRVRGLYHKKIDLRYENSIYTGGDPSWFTADGSGGWLADESAPTGIVFLPPATGSAGIGAKPRILVSSPVAESGHGLAWLDLTGKKVYGVRGIGAGGGWCGGTYLARDAGSKPLPGVEAYSLSIFNGQLEVWATGVNRKIYSQPSGDPAVASTWGGIAARDGLLAISLPRTNELLFVNAARGAKVDSAPLADPRGLAFDAAGRLLAISHDRVVRMEMAVTREHVRLSEIDPHVLVSAGLEDPHQLALDADGNIYVSDWGNSHQVKVFDPEGKPLRKIGAAAWSPDEHHDPARMSIPINGVRVGPYDPTHMHQPTQLTIDSDNHLWIAESTYVPKRISVWTLDGKLVKAMYGPANYGGAGAVDPQDKSLFFIGVNYGTLQYRIDWQTGESKLESICWLQDGQANRGISSIPQYPLAVHGHRFITNLYSEGEVSGENTAFFWQFKDGILTPIAAMGNAGGWTILRDERFRPRWPKGVDYQKDYKSKPLLFAWSDLNHDGQVQPEEVEFIEGGCSSLTVDGEMGLTSTDGWFFPARFEGDVPVYDLTKRMQLCADGRGVITSGGANGLSGRDGFFVTCSTPSSLPWGYVTGVRGGQITWTYPCEAIGLHAGYAADRTPPHPGYVYAITRVLGQTFTPPGVDAELWAVNGNYGEVYVMTTDGLFVSTLFRDVRLASPLPPKAVRGESLTNTTLNQEDFLPTITQANDGHVYVVCQHAQSVIVRVDGFDTIRRLPDKDLQVTPARLADASTYFVNREARRLANQPPEVLNVSIRAAGPAVDGKLDDWQNVQWARLDEHASAAVMVAGDKLYAALRTDAANALDNNGPAVSTLFKSGGGMDLMIETDPAADPNRQHPAAGDERLLVALIKGKPAAFLYRPVLATFGVSGVFGLPGGKTDFTSPVRSISMADVKDVSGSVQIASAPGGYEISIPLEKLGLHPKPGEIIRGDLGLLRGDGVETVQRLYWHNKKTGVVSDIPSEAELTPQLWGQWRFLQQ